jgi:hypothetical protein
MTNTIYDILAYTERLDYTTLNEFPEIYHEEVENNVNFDIEPKSIADKAEIKRQLKHLMCSKCLIIETRCAECEKKFNRLVNLL